MPSNQAAWVTKVNGYPLEILESPYNAPGPGELIIKNHAVAINPVDWKQQDHGYYIDEYPSIFGCDVAGVVDEVGPEVTQFKKGDRVIGNAVPLTLGARYAAFQIFVLLKANVTCKIPDSISFEQGCVLPLAVNTAGQGIFGKDFLNVSLSNTGPKPAGEAIFVYGGSSSVGIVAIQLAKAVGLEVVATASKRNHDLCRSVGADHVIDYTDENWVDNAVAALKGKKVVGGFDAIADSKTMKMSHEVLAQVAHEPFLATVLPPLEGKNAKNVFGTSVTLDEALASSIWTDFLPQALERGTVVPKPDPIIAGVGLESIQKGLDMQKAGVSAAKVVVKVA